MTPALTAQAIRLRAEGHNLREIRRRIGKPMHQIKQALAQAGAR